MIKPFFTGVILAGGASRRMGTDKAVLRVDGSPMLDLIRQKLTEAGAEKVVILGRGNVQDGIADSEPGAGPVCAAVQYLEQQPHRSKHLFVPVDMPALSPALLTALACQDRWAYFADHNLPFLAIADGTKIAPPRRLQDLLRAKDARRLTLPENCFDPFVNLNDPTDFARYVGRKPAPTDGKRMH